MPYLQGEQVKISTPVLRKLIGTKVQILPSKDVCNKRGLSMFKRIGTIDEVLNKNVSIDGNWYHFSEIYEIVKVD